MGRDLNVIAPFFRTPASVAACAAFGIIMSAGQANAADAETLPNAAQVAVAHATNACFSAAIQVTGFLIARSEAFVNFDAPGYKISEVLAEEGSQVTNGQILARLLPVSDTADSTAAQKPATTNANTLKAPAAGLIIRSTAAIAATAPTIPTEPLFRILVDGEIELEAEVPSINLPSMTSGQPARIEIENKRELSGRVRLVPTAVDQKTQLGRVRVSIEPTPGLRLGMFARATIDADRSCGVSVPRSSVTYRTEGTSVQVVRNNVVEARQVKIGLESDTDIEIREGLANGDMVVANAGSSLRDGDKVSPLLVDSAGVQLR